MNDQRDAPACVHELIERQARRTPDATALVGVDTELTYVQMDRRANRLARRLRELGAGPETIVAVHLERDVELVISLLAVLKSGAAYLPLDPATSTDRLRVLLADAGATAVVTRATHSRQLPAGRWQVLCIDAGAESIARQPSGPLDRLSSPRNLAYLIYTSGSTGRPKGVLVEHRSLANYLDWCVRRYAGRGTGGGTAVFSPIAFDAVVPNIYPSLILGQRVCVLPETANFAEIAERLATLAPFDFIKLTPGHLDLLANLLDRPTARRLAGTLVVGADAFPSRVLTAWRRLDPDTPVLNEYGPTEASVGNSVHAVAGPYRGELVPIGIPISNTTMYVLDDRLQPCPAGVAGELYIGGDCVVRGYAGMPALTAGRFVPDPLSHRPGARMYRTGDIGLAGPDGGLEFLGRVDDQVKINGYRVEPAEVEAALAAHPAVRQAVAVAVGDRANLRLVAYYVPAGQVSPAGLAEHLERVLPSYLLPAGLLPISEIPLNANGKVDRKALPDPRVAVAAAAGRKAGW